MSLVAGWSLNPFKTETKDRSQPVLVKSLESLSEYRAATANMQEIVAAVGSSASTATMIATHFAT